MAGAFHFESRLFRLIEKGISLIKLNIIWILCSIPLVTGGAALCALHVTAVRILRDEEGYVFRDFWRVFTSKLGFSLKLWIPLLAAAAGLIFDYMFWQGVDGGFADGMRVLVCVLAGVCLLSLPAFGKNGYAGRDSLPQWDPACVQVSSTDDVSIVHYRRLLCGRASVDAGVWSGYARRRFSYGNGTWEDADMDI